MTLSPGTRLGSYEITSLLGSGGMGQVYRAKDLKLDRDVAIKVLREELATDPERLRRFEQEARSASALNHPNIITIHDIGKHGDTPYIAMEYVEGKTLRELLAEGPLPTRKLLQLATQIAEGLAKAHSAGIIHRDLKPENMMISSDGYVKILDFGLAKLLAQPGADSEADTMTKEGTVAGAVMGTASYMSPEQALGKPLDARTDVFSLGAVLYELATGSRPFQGETPAGLFNEILNKTPATPSSLNSELPEDIVSVISQALNKDPGQRYPSAKELLADLGDIGTEPLAADTSSQKSIVVLPFENMSPDPDQEYFCDGMTEEIIADLSKIQSLRVISRTSSMMLKGSRKDIHAIAKEIDVLYVLEGSVRKAGNKLRITAQLIDALNDAHLWAEKYSGTLDDVFEIQEEVSGSIVDALKLTLSPEEQQKMAKRPIEDTAAYEWYLRATGAASTYTKDSLVEALRHFELALDVVGADPLIYAGMADTYLRLVNVGVEIEQNRKRAEELAHKALALDPEMPKARALLASLGIWYAGGKVNLQEAARQFKRALAADPVEPVALLGMACVYFWAGRISEAAAFADRLRQIEPLDVVANAFKGFRYSHDGRYDEALQVWRDLYEHDPRHPGSLSLSAWQCFYAHALAYTQRTDEAFALIDEAEATNPNNKHTRLAIMLRHALRGDKDGALRELTPTFYEWCRRDATWSHFVACDFAYLEANEEALDWLENAVNLGHINYPLFAEKDVFLAKLHGDPGFERLMERVRREWEEFEV